MNKTSVSSNTIFLDLILVFFFLFSTISFGQELTSGNLKGFFNTHVGTNVDEEPVRSITNDYTSGFEIGLINETIGNNEWEQLYNYPEYGVSLFFSSLGNDQIFGHEIALTPFIKIDLFTWPKLSVFGRIGMGFSYLNTIANPITNPNNPATSSHYNFHTNLRTGIQYILSKNIEINSGVSFDHISNGNINKPNLGLNSLSFYAGLNYYLHSKKTKKNVLISPHTKQINLLIYLGIGGKRNNVNSNYYIPYSLSLELRKSLTKMFSFGFGSNIYWDPSIKSSLKSLNKKESSTDNLQTGLYISQSFNYNKLTVTLQEALYIFFHDKVGDNYFYTNANIEYNFYKNILIRLSLKSHEFHILDHPEIGLGYRF